MDTRIRWIAVAFAATAVALWSPAPRAQAVQATQSSAERGVTLKVTPVPPTAGAAEWSFTVALDTHSGSLDDDLAKSAVLVVDGKEMAPTRWSGPAPGGHHRQGVLSFPAPAEPAQAIELRIQRAGEDAPRVFRWDGAALR